MKRNSIIENDVAHIAKAPLAWERFAGKTILISGANGFLPAYMVETFAYLNETRNFGCTVLALVRNRVKAETRFAHLLGRPGLELVVQDVCTPVTPGRKLDFIIHAASQASPKYFGSDPVGTLSANTLGTHALLTLAAAERVEGFLFFSSGEVYGNSATAGATVREDVFGQLDPMDVRSCYGESKRLGETMCVAFNEQYGVPVQVVRPSHTYGPGMALGDGRSFSDFTANIVRHENIVVKSTGVVKRPFCYLADAVTGYFTVMLKGANRAAYNVGNEDCYLSIGELAELLVGLFPERKLRVDLAADRVEAGYIPSPVQGGVLDTAKLRALGWSPVVGLEEGFRRTVLSYEC